MKKALLLTALLAAGYATAEEKTGDYFAGIDSKGVISITLSDFTSQGIEHLEAPFRCTFEHLHPTKQGLHTTGHFVTFSDSGEPSISSGVFMQDDENLTLSSRKKHGTTWEDYFIGDGFSHFLSCQDINPNSRTISLDTPQKENCSLPTRDGAVTCAGKWTSYKTR